MTLSPPNCEHCEEPDTLASVVDTDGSGERRVEQGPSRVIFALLVLSVLLAMFQNGLADLVETWNRKPEYSHGYFIPIISLLLAWQRLDRVHWHADAYSWAGLAVCAAGTLVYAVGQLSAQYLLVQYALLIVLTGLVWAGLGLRGMRALWAPLVFLIFMVPLPSFVFRELSTTLQLLSSELGVALISAAGISVFLEGNVIDLGSFKLEVVEACSGLRYLFPFLSFGFICAVLFRAPLWQRILVFVSTVPISIAFNSARIGAVGVMVEHWGIGVAEGFLHYFEGWLIFMACVACLLGEIALLIRLTNRGAAFGEAFSLPLPRWRPKALAYLPRPSAPPYAASVVLLVLTALAIGFSDIGDGGPPARKSFVEFPDRFDSWTGFRDSLDAPVIETLALNDYVLGDYVDEHDNWVNLFAAYYEEQRSGKAPHSPQKCIPGGGWEIVGFSTPTIDAGASSFEINRVEIRRRNRQQLVYYWFDQRGRWLTGEHEVKAYNLWDAVTRNRTDGALVRVTTPLRPGEGWEAADRRLTEFVTSIRTSLPAFIPH